MLRYAPGDWNALHRDLYGDLVFPLQVVIGLDAPGVDYTGAEFVVVEQRPRAQSRATASVIGQGDALVFTTRAIAGAIGAGMVGGPDAARRERAAVRTPPHARPRLPRLHVSPRTTPRKSPRQLHVASGTTPRKSAAFHVAEDATDVRGSRATMSTLTSTVGSTRNTRIRGHSSKSPDSNVEVPRTRMVSGSPSGSSTRR